MCPQLKKRGDDSKRQLPTRPALLHEGVPTAIQSKGFERFPGKPMLLSGERLEAGKAEESLKGNLALPRPLPGISSVGEEGAHTWGWEQGGNVAEGFSQRLLPSWSI